MINTDTTTVEYDLTIGDLTIGPYAFRSGRVSEERKLDIVEIVFQEKIGTTSKVDVTFRDSEEFDVRFDEIKLRTPLSLSLGWFGNKYSLFEGQVAKVRPSFEQEGSSELQITAYDRGYLLKKPQQLTHHYASTFYDLVKKMLNRYKADFDEFIIEPVEKLRNWKMSDEDSRGQFEETDLEILTWIAEKSGYHIVVRGRTIYFVDRDYFSRRQGDDKYTFYYRPKLKDEDDDHGMVLYGFEPAMDLSGQRKKVEVTSWSSVADNGIKYGNKSIESSARGKKGFTEVIVETGEKLILKLFGQVAQNKAAAQAMAEAELDRRANSLAKGEANIKGWPLIRAGQRHTFMLRALGDIGRSFSGEYIIDAVEHRWDGTLGFKTNFDVSRDTLNKTD